MTDLVERLRHFDGVKGYGLGELCVEAADEIERLRHENMRLQTADDYAFGPNGELAKRNRTGSERAPEKSGKSKNEPA